MYQVNELYESFKDEWGHTYLVKKSNAVGFFKSLDAIEESYSEHKDEDVFNEEFNDLLEYFNVKTLEDERHYVVLLDDVEEDE